MRGLSSLALLLALGLAACSKTEPTRAATDAGPSAVASASVAVAASAPAPSASAARAAWIVGHWTGTYQAQHYLIEVPKNEGASEWGADDGSASAGEGKVDLVVSDSGRVTGTADGPLGRQTLSGEADGESLRVNAAPLQRGDRAFAGVVVLSRNGERLEGRLQASTGDSRTVRDAPVSLERAKTAAPASSH